MCVCMTGAAQLFQTLGSGASASLLNVVIIGCVNIVATMVSVFVSDRSANESAQHSMHAVSATCTSQAVDQCRGNALHAYESAHGPPQTVCTAEANAEVPLLQMS